MPSRLDILYFIAEALRGDTRFPDRFHGHARSRIDWEQIVHAANIHLLTPALWTGLQRHGVSKCLPEDVRDYLAELHELSTARNQALRHQTLHALGLLEDAGIPTVLMKGAAYLFTGEFPDPADRIMSDIDVLVPGWRAGAALETLMAGGYLSTADSGTEYDGHRHLPPLVRNGDYAAIEIHTALLPAHLEMLLPEEETWQQAESLETAGQRIRVLSPHARILVNFAHAQLVDRGHGKGFIPLRSLFETWCVIRRQRENLDWDWLQERIREGGQKDAYDAYLQLLGDLFGETADGWQPTRQSRLHALRCRTQWRWPVAARLGRSIYRHFGRESMRRQGLPADTVAATWISRARNLPRFLHSTLTGSGRQKWMAKTQPAEPPAEKP